MIWETNGTLADASAKVALASPGDKIKIPAGNWTWGASAASLIINKAVQVQGAGRGLTTITISDSGPTGTNALIKINGGLGCIFCACDIVGSASASTTPFSWGVLDYGRVTDVGFTQNASGFFAYVGKVYGLCDHCDITGFDGASELIFIKGKDDSWQTNSSMGGAENFFIEDCTYNGAGYVCDANSNARVVVRYNTFNSQTKVDGHGYASNSDPIASVRHMEVYENLWTSATSFWPAIEMRGGTFRVFNNTTVGVGYEQYFILKEYGAEAQWPNFGNQYQTPFNRPIIQQIGIGKDPTVQASEPGYIWNNRATGGSVRWQLTQEVFDPDMDAAACAHYATQIGVPGATYKMSNVVVNKIDYFRDGDSVYNSTTGVLTGLASAMGALTPVTVNVGFWATDQEKLYSWDGAAWNFIYQPYTYPHPQNVAVTPSPMSDSLILNQTVNSDPVTELWFSGPSNEGPLEYRIFTHSGNYPQYDGSGTPESASTYRMPDGVVLGRHGMSNDHVYIFQGTITLAQAINATN